MLFLPFNSLKPLHHCAMLNPGNSVGGIIMKINWYKIASAAQLLIGVAAIVAFLLWLSTAAISDRG